MSCSAFHCQPMRYIECMKKISDLDNMACFQVYQLHHAFGRYYQAAFADTGLTYAKYVMLKALAAQKGMSLSDLSACLGVEPNTLSPLAKKMAGFGVIERVRDPEDERRIVLRPTTYGLEILKAADQVVMQNFADLGISADDASQAIAIMSRLRTAVEKASPARVIVPDAPLAAQDVPCD